MRPLRQPWLILIAGFGTVLLLVVLLGRAATQRGDRFFQDVVSTHDAYIEAAAALHRIPADLYLTAALVRDHVMDASADPATDNRAELTDVTDRMRECVKLVESYTAAEDASMVAELNRALERYFVALKPVFLWERNQRLVFGPDFVRERLLPRRNAVLQLTEQIAALNEANLQSEKERLALTQEAFRKYLRTLTIAAFSTGLVIAVIASAWIFRLQRRSREEHARVEVAEEELRRLSQRLVRTQEAERRSLSRELHDEVGQMLTGIRMELTTMEKVRTRDPEKLPAMLEDAKGLVEETLQAVRDLAMGLRPSMLDDLGLAPALLWQTREFSRRSGIAADTSVDGVLEDLPEEHRTCIYRVVQEALTNCARHAKATSVRVTIHGDRDSINVTVQDDGVGFDPMNQPRRGLGLLGIEERVRELQGRFTVTSQPNKGTVLNVCIPLQGVGV